MCKINVINDFKNLKISKMDLYNVFKKDLHLIFLDNPVIVNTSDVISLLEAYRYDRLTLNDLLEWVNTIWFTDLFEYDDNQCNSIASVMNVLEELDEADNSLSQADIDKYISALTKNEEI